MQAKTYTEKKQKILTARVSPKYLETIQQGSGVLLISVGKPHFEQDHLSALLKLIFSLSVQIRPLVADTLQRFNIFSEHYTERHFTLEQAQALALQKGDDWRGHYQERWVVSCSSTPIELLSWQSYINDPAFERMKTLVFTQLEKDPDYVEALKNSIDAYQGRQKNKAMIPTHLFNENCKNYLIEECAVLLILAQKGEKYVLYPGLPQEVLKYTLENLIPAQNLPKLTWISIRFKRIEALASSGLTSTWDV